MDLSLTKKVGTGGPISSNIHRVTEHPSKATPYCPQILDKVYYYRDYYTRVRECIVDHGIAGHEGVSVAARQPCSKEVNLKFKDVLSEDDFLTLKQYDE
ncbi:hypothetical protein RvY_15143 [Ramazzottius varieornatus]|uniref:Uncharacterized protein n=1 Tax=Ramazzottius varieornatus TaxID=947166 RepID=A0A1D1VXD0_RAMVA|nr:hypothetical protein RvY_15143 [Ramazzottius varieornatus]